MRKKLSLILFMGLFFPAMSGSAVDIQDDPLMFTVGSGGNQIVGEIRFLSVTATILVVDVQVTSGTLAGLSVLVCETMNCSNVREPTGTGTTPGDDVRVTSQFIANDEAHFTFASFDTSAGASSDPFDVDYSTDNLGSGDFIWITLLGPKNNPAGTVPTKIVP